MNTVQPAGTGMIANFVVIVLLIVGAGAGAYFGYEKYSEWTKLQEVQSFTKTSFHNKPEEIKAALENKVPTLFRVAPPGLEVINNFPFREKVVRKEKPLPIGSSMVTQPSLLNPVNGSYSGGGSYWVTNYSPQRETRIIKASEIDGYRYAKNSLNHLAVEVRFVAIFESTEKPCGGGHGTDCVIRRTYEKYARMQLVIVDNNWDIVSVRAEETPEIVVWLKGTEDPQHDQSLPDLIPTTFQPHQPLTASVDATNSEIGRNEFYKN